MNIDQFENIALDAAVGGAKIKKQMIELMRQFDVIAKDYEYARQQLSESVGELNGEERKMLDNRLAKLRSRKRDAINEIISDEENDECDRLIESYYL